MAPAHESYRSRVIKLVVALCMVSALAFLLGQGAAAFRAGRAQARTTTPPQIFEQVSGARGILPTPTPASEQQLTTTSEDRPQTDQKPLKGNSGHGDGSPSHDGKHGKGDHGGNGD